MPRKTAIIIQECFWEGGGWVFACLGQELLLQLITGDKVVQGGNVCSPMAVLSQQLWGGTWGQGWR